MLYNEPLYLAGETVGLAADRCEAGTETEQERGDFGRHACGWQ